METRSAFFFGMGVMGVLAGFGLGGTHPNKLALLIGAGSLFYANHLTPLVDVSPRGNLTDSWESIPGMPDMPEIKEPEGGWKAWGRARA
jgi:hypothetical protein